MIGILLIMAGLVMGIDVVNLRSYLSNDYAYGDQQTYVTETAIESITFDLDTRDIVIRHHESETFIIHYYQHDKETWTIEETNGVFYVKQKEDVRQWFFFRFPAKTYRSIELYVPHGADLSLLLKTQTGSIKTEFEDPQDYRNVLFESSTGSITVHKVSAQKFTAKTQTGSVDLRDIVSVERIYAQSSTGSVTVKNVTASGITIKTDTGSALLESSQSTESVSVRVSTGDVVVKSTEAPSFDLASSTGDISFTALLNVDYSMDLSVSTGSIRVFGDAQGKNYVRTSGDVSIVAKTSTGSIRIQSS